MQVRLRAAAADKLLQPTPACKQQGITYASIHGHLSSPAPVAKDFRLQQPAAQATRGLLSKQPLNVAAHRHGLVIPLQPALLLWCGNHSGIACTACIQGACAQDHNTATVTLQRYAMRLQRDVRRTRQEPVSAAALPASCIIHTWHHRT
jgi:hypothetical protein